MGKVEAAGNAAYGVVFFQDDDGSYTKINVELAKSVIQIDLARVYVANLAGANIEGTSQACYNCKALPLFTSGKIYVLYILFRREEGI